MDRTVRSLLLASMEKYRNRTAFADQNGERRITYGELDELSGKIAAELLKRGVKKGDRVSVQLPRRYEFFAAGIGAMKLGCCFINLVMEYPRDRVDYIQKDSGSAILIDLDLVRAAQRNEPLTEYPPLSGDDDAFIIYTSGSTGRPKGILHSQRSFYTFISTNLHALKADCGEVFLDTVTHSFLLSFFDYIYLGAGAAVHIMDEAERKDIRAVEDYILNQAITTAVIVPAQQKIFHNRSRSLKKVLSAGERISGQYSGEYRIINCYGASEAGAYFNFCLDRAYENTPIGTPLEGSKIYILDERGDPVPDGEEGELCVSGPALCKGYLNLPEQNARTFVKNPFPAPPGHEILFHTGDIVKQLPDGNVVYLNRKDFMVKVNGQRVETGEIETRTAAIAGIRQAVVKGFENALGNTYLVDYYVADREIGEEAIRAQLQKSLPAYMIPAFFVRLDAMPLNQNGKLDRLSLQPPVMEERKAEYAAPSDAIEQNLCRAYEEILHCGQVGVNDDFFRLGGDSICAMQLAIRVSGDGSISASDVYAFPRVAQLAALVRKRQIGSDDLYSFSLGQKENTPLFFVHPANTGPESYRDVAKGLPGTLPFFCLENHNLIYPDIEVRGIGRVASLYNYYMKSVIGRGPVLLGGWSYGGVVAFEMALQLQKRGAEVPCLILLDPYLVREQDRDAVLAMSGDPNLKKYFQEEELFADIRSEKGVDLLWENNNKVLLDIANYRPDGVYKGKTLFLRATVLRESDSVKKLCHGEYANGFGEFCSDIQVIDIPCDHDALGQNETAVQRIAEFVKPFEDLGKAE